MNTEDKVLKLREEFPEIRAIEIHRRIGVSRERVRQILNKYNLPTRILIEKPKCIECNINEVSYGSKKCRDCFLSNSWDITECANCGGEVKFSVSHDKYRMKTGRYSGDRYCKRECFYNRNHKEVNNE